MDTMHVPEVDATSCASLSATDVDAFRAAGVLIARGVLGAAELDALQTETGALVQWTVDDTPDHADVRYANHQITGRRVPYRIEYVIDKTQSCKALLAHPFILRSVEMLQGRNLVPTWDSMVFKMEGEGAAIPWHRDDTCPSQDEPWGLVFNVDFYLDGSDDTNCLWVIPGTNALSREVAAAEVQRRNDGGFDPSGAVPVPMRPGDVIFHSVSVLHGSPPARSGLRRVIYYEFRSAEYERAHGPHVPAYVPLKQQVLESCLRERARTSYAAGEEPFVYRPSPEFGGHPTDDPSSYRYVHNDYWRR